MSKWFVVDIASHNTKDRLERSRQTLYFPHALLDVLVMGDSVERALEETIPVLQAAKRARLLSSQEIDQVVRKRRNHEYALKKKNALRVEYLKYASFERELANLLQKRADKMKIKKKTAQLIVGKTSSRVNLVYSRAVKAFRGDADLWLHYARHCVKTGTVRTAQKVLARAIAYRGDCERVWLAAVALHFDTCGDAKGARKLAQRALRAIPHSVVLWKEYFRLELSYLSKLIIRRLAIGRSPAPELSKEEAPQQLGIAKDSAVRAIPSRQVAGEATETKQADSHEDTEEFSAENSFEAEIAIAEQHVDNAEHRKERSESSESESSEEDSAAEGDSDTSDLSSDNDSDGEIERNDNLSFWEGGVPMTVFMRACNRVNLSAEVLLEFWVIAVSSPYVPPLFLTVMAKHISKRFPNSTISRLIEARAEWDCARTEFCREKARDSTKKSSFGDSSPDTGNDMNRKVLDVTTKIPDRLGSVLRPERISKLSDSEQNAAVACIRDVEATLKRNAASRTVADKLNSLLIIFDQGNGHEGAKVSNKNENHENTALNAESWSLASLEDAIAQGKTKCGDWRCGDVLSVVKQKAGVPFRDIYHDKLVRQFLAVETDIKAVREVTDVLLATPPLTMEGIRCTIAAEMRILDESATSSHSVLSEETKTRLRRLFAKCEALSSARHDVEFWLLFIDFERRKAKDARATSAVHAKALRALTKEKVELFTELHTLRNLE